MHKLVFILALASWAVSRADAQATFRASVDSTSVEGNAASAFPVTSDGGRFTVFASDANNLIPGDVNQGTDVFVRDRITGQTACVSLGLSGMTANGFSDSPRVTPDGRFVAFASNAGDLVSGDTNGALDVFVRDLLLGTTAIVSRASSGAPANGHSYAPAISDDGRFVAFLSSASNLVAGDGNGFDDVFVLDRTSGTIVIASQGAGGASNGASGFGTSGVAISGDGRFVALLSAATNLVAGDVNNAADVFVRDLNAGTTTRENVGAGGLEANGGATSLAISRDGNYVAFATTATNLIPNDTDNVSDVFVRNRATSFTTRESLTNASGEAFGSSYEPSISADGRFVAFWSAASNLVPGDTIVFDAFLRDRQTAQTEKLSADPNGNLGDGPSASPAVSPDGRWVAFATDATNLVPGDTNGKRDVMLRDRGEPPTFASYCFGDGTATGCPCGNATAVGRQEGCMHSLGYGGKLTAIGRASVGNDTFILIGTSMPDSSALYFQGSQRQNAGQGSVFGDGLRCAGGAIVRLEPRTNSSGTSRCPLTGEMPISARSPISAGDTRTYQCWYRNASVTFCTSATFNLTNAIEQVWAP